MLVVFYYFGSTDEISPVEGKIKLGVSSCLLGNRVRYDGAHQRQSLILQLDKQFELIPFCPEIEIGLGVPRDKIQLVQRDQKIVCLDQLTYQVDYTEPLKKLTVKYRSWLDQISGYIFKTKSPSCGLTKVKVDIDGEILAIGQGIFAAQIKQQYPRLPLIEEDEFNDQDKRSRFLQAVHDYADFSRF